MLGEREMVPPNPSLSTCHTTDKVNRNGKCPHLPLGFRNWVQRLRRFCSWGLRCLDCRSFFRSFFGSKCKSFSPRCQLGLKFSRACLLCGASAKSFGAGLLLLLNLKQRRPFGGSEICTFDMIKFLCHPLAASLARETSTPLALEFLSSASESCRVDSKQQQLYSTQ